MFGVIRDSYEKGAGAKCDHHKMKVRARVQCACTLKSGYARCTSGPSLYYVSKRTGWMDGSRKWLTFSTVFMLIRWVGSKKAKNMLT